MAVTHVQATRDAIATTISGQVGSGAKLVLYTSGDAEIATLVHTGTATVTAQDVIFDSFADDTNATGGTVDYATIETSGDVEVIRFTDPVNEISAPATVTNGDTVTVSSNITYSAPT